MYATDHDDDLNSILRHRDDLFVDNKNPWEISAAFQQYTPPMAKEILNLCRAPSVVALFVLGYNYEWVYDPPAREPFLGSGGFGVVFEIEEDEEHQAVKFSTFSHDLRRRWIKHQHKDPLDECFKASITAVASAAFFKAPATARDPVLNAAAIDRAVLEHALPDIEGCRYTDEQKAATFQAAQQFVATVKEEVDQLLAFDDFSFVHENPAHRSFPKIFHNIVTSRLEVFMVMEVLEASFREVWDACRERVLENERLAVRLTFNLKLVYQAALINELGYTHCDIKPDNIMFKRDSDFEDFYITDYGLMTTGERCRGLTAGWAPKEIYLPAVARAHGAPEPKTPFFTRPVQLHDSFSIGMVMLSLEIEKRDFSDIRKDYLTLVKNENINNGAMWTAWYGKIKAALSKRLVIYEDFFVRKYKKAIESRFHAIILRLLDSDTTKRLPLKVALLLIYDLIKHKRAKSRDFATYDHWMLANDNLIAAFGLEELSERQGSHFHVKPQDRADVDDHQKLFFKYIEDIQKVLKKNREVEVI